MTTQIKQSGSVLDNSSLAAGFADVAESAGIIRLIFVDDDDDYREAVGAELAERGFLVSGFADGASMLEFLAGGGCADIIVLDWSLPVISGVDLLQKLKRKGIVMPVVFLTGRGSLAHENMAFDLGALDFVDKTRGVEILAKRLRLIVEAGKRPPAADPGGEVLHCGRLMLKPYISRAYWDDVDVNLTLTEFNIVRLLASTVGAHVTYRAVYDCMHYAGFIAGSGEDGYRTNVRSSIKRIRNKFRAIDADFAEIENFPSFGYRWGRAPANA
jgi:two-component system, OmpR family, response regulator ChvI